MPASSSGPCTAPPPKPPPPPPPPRPPPATNGTCTGPAPRPPEVSAAASGLSGTISAAPPPPPPPRPPRPRACRSRPAHVPLEAIHARLDLHIHRADHRRSPVRNSTFAVAHIGLRTISMAVPPCGFLPHELAIRRHAAGPADRSSTESPGADRTASGLVPLRLASVVPAA